MTNCVSLIRFQEGSQRLILTIQPLTVPDRLKEGHLFDVERVCNGCRRTRGSKCTRFELNPASGREDMSNLLLLMCYKGGALWNHTAILYLLLLVSIIMPLDWETIIFNNQPGYEWLGYDY